MAWALHGSAPSFSKLTCSPKTDPATMRVQQPGLGRRRTLNEKKSQPGADRPQATRGRRKACRRSFGPRGREAAWDQRGYLPPLEKPLRWDEPERDQAPQGARKGEYPPQEDRGRAGGRHKHPKGGEPGKLLSPARRQAAVARVQQELGVSERRACKVIGQPRSSQRYVGCKASRDGVLVGRMITLSRENPRYGYRRIWALLRGEGWQINKKRVHRLWKEQGLRVTAKQRKRRRRLLGHSENSCARKRAEYKDHVWSYDDFVMDRTEDGRTLKMMPIVDEYTRECLCIKVERSITAKEEVVEALAALFAHRGEPPPSFARITVPSSSPRPSSVGSRSQELRACTLSRVLRGRTPTHTESGYTVAQRLRH